MFDGSIVAKSVTIPNSTSKFFKNRCELVAHYTGTDVDMIEVL
jgi:hypothetical protein